MPQGLLKCFEVLMKCRNKFDCLVYEMLTSVKAKSQRAIRLHSCQIIFIIFLNLRAKQTLNVAICMIFCIFSLIMESCILRNVKILSFVFTILCFKKSLNTHLVFIFILGCTVASMGWHCSPNGVQC